MYCERCDEKFKWYETVCPTCQGPLVPDPPGIAAEPETPIVQVFHTADEGLLPLATLALDQAGIEYSVRKAGLSDVFGVSHPTPGFGSTGLGVSVHVLADDEERARAVLVDLERAAPMPPVAGEVEEDQLRRIEDLPASGGRVELFDGDSGEPLGSLSPKDFAWLSKHLVRESDEDRDYWVDSATLDMLEREGADDAVVRLFRRALGARDGVNVRWR